MAAENVEIVRGIYAAWPKGIDAFLDTLAEDIEWQFADNFVYGAVNPLIGRKALREGSLKSLKTDWEGFDGELDELLDAGETVVGLGYYIGTYKATGRHLRAQFAHFWTLADGEVVRWRQYVDTRQFADVMMIGEAGPAPDELAKAREQAGALSGRFEAAWNAHDMTALADIFAVDATFVSRFGHFWRGREEIAARHAEIYATISRDCTIANRLLDVELVDRRTAVAHVRSHIRVGSSMPMGPGAFSVVFTYVATCRDGRWRIQAGYNVAVMDPVTGKPVVED